MLRTRRANPTRLSILAAVAVLVAAVPAGAVDLATTALVEIVEGVAITETQTLDFGVLALTDGSVVVAASDGGVTDADNMVVDATGISQGVFDVTGVVGADLVADCTAGALPAGIALSAFTADWADLGAEAAVPTNRTMAASTEVLEIGATITIDETTASLTGGTPADLPYTVTVVYQ
ncbi:DUF4402 domain-containing protein [bacterium]|nr:DUF4402 domain-containing protein [bacterium]